MGGSLRAGGEDHTINIWEMYTGTYLYTLQEHTATVQSVRFSPDGRMLASGSSDGMIKLWQTKTGACVNTLHAPRLYEGMNITDVTGLTEEQKELLKALGAIEKLNDEPAEK